MVCYISEHTNYHRRLVSDYSSNLQNRRDFCNISLPTSCCFTDIITKNFCIYRRSFKHPRYANASPDISNHQRRIVPSRRVRAGARQVQRVCRNLVYAYIDDFLIWRTANTHRYFSINIAFTDHILTCYCTFD